MIASHTGSYVGENRRARRNDARRHAECEAGPARDARRADPRRRRGIPAFYTPTGVGTLVAEGKEVREFDGRQYLLERALTADFALVKAWKGDRMGNLVYRKTARNFNPMMASAAKITIAEVEHLVEPGELDPDQVVTPGIYVQRVVVGEHFEKRIEKRTVAAEARMTDRSREARTHRPPRGPRAARRFLRQPRHRHPDDGFELRAAGHRRRSAIGKRHAGRRPVSDRRRRGLPTLLMPARKP